MKNFFNSLLSKFRIIVSQRKSPDFLYKGFTWILAVLFFFSEHHCSIGQEKNGINYEKTAPELVLFITNDVLFSIKNHNFPGSCEVENIINNCIWPHVDLTKIVKLVMGRYWNQMNKTQIESLTRVFHKILTGLYGKILASTAKNITDVRVFSLKEYKFSDEMIVRSLFFQSKAPPVNIDYRLEKSENHWKIFDINIEGIWLVESYRNQFSYKISRDGIDGLIESLWKNYLRYEEHKN